MVATGCSPNSNAPTPLSSASGNPSSSAPAGVTPTSTATPLPLLSGMPRLAYSDGTSVSALRLGEPPVRVGDGNSPVWSLDGRSLAWTSDAPVSLLPSPTFPPTNPPADHVVHVLDTDFEILRPVAGSNTLKSTVVHSTLPATSATSGTSNDVLWVGAAQDQLYVVVTQASTTYYQYSPVAPDGAQVAYMSGT